MTILISYLLLMDATGISGWHKQGLAGQNEEATFTSDLLKQTH